MSTHVESPHRYDSQDTADAEAVVNSILLVWDAPNIDVGLGSIVGGRPASNQRPRFDAVGMWLIQQADRLAEEIDEDVEPEATLFTNVSTRNADSARPWLEALRNIGFAVFARPKIDEDSDVDDNMIDHIQRRYDEGALKGLVVASADGRNFQDLLEDLAAEGIPVTVVGFHEQCTWAIDSQWLKFKDIENIPGVFREPLPRISLDNLPEEGAWMRPFRSLRALANATPH